MIIYFIYNLVLNILSPMLILYYLLRVVITKKETGGFKQRLGFFSPEAKKVLKDGPWIWIHAVSVGEVVAASPMIKEIKNLNLPYKILLSTVTDTGYVMAKRIVPEVDCIIYFPLDLSFIVKKVVNLISPRVVVLVETELWPNFLHYAKKSGAKILMLNGRLSEKSFKGYYRFRKILKPVLNNLDLLGMQSDVDAHRIISIGADPHRVRIVGNTKLDVNFLVLSPEQKNKIKDDFLVDNSLFLTAGSTHKGEEEIIISVYSKLLTKFGNLRLILAPRHLDRIKEIEDIIIEKGLSYLRCSNASPPFSAQVIILDTIGDLAILYSISDIVFVGGSLVNKGGHNILEPISAGKVVLHGPYMNNFKEIVKLFKSTGAVIEVENEEAIYDKISHLLPDRDTREKLGKLAQGVIEKNKGSSQVCALLVKDLISS